MASDFRNNLQPPEEPELKFKAQPKAEKKYEIESTDAPLDDKNANKER